MSHKRRAVFTMVVCFGNLIFTREAFAQGLVHKLAQPASGRGRDRRSTQHLFRLQFRQRLSHG
jgi:hypothetical protein